MPSHLESRLAVLERRFPHPLLRPSDLARLSEAQLSELRRIEDLLGDEGPLMARLERLSDDDLSILEEIAVAAQEDAR